MVMGCCCCGKERGEPEPGFDFFLCKGCGEELERCLEACAEAARRRHENN